jgi:hypothetical protein
MLKFVSSKSIYIKNYTFSQSKTIENTVAIRAKKTEG